MPSYECLATSPTTLPEIASGIGSDFTPTADAFRAMANGGFRHRKTSFTCVVFSQRTKSHGEHGACLASQSKFSIGSSHPLPGTNAGQNGLLFRELRVIVPIGLTGFTRLLQRKGVHSVWHLHFLYAHISLANYGFPTSNILARWIKTHTLVGNGKHFYPGDSSSDTSTKSVDATCTLNGYSGFSGRFTLVVHPRIGVNDFLERHITSRQSDRRINRSFALTARVDLRHQPLKTERAFADRLGPV